MKYLKILWILLWMVTGCSSPSLTPEQSFEKLMLQAKTAAQKGDFTDFESLYTEASDRTIIEQDYALDYSALDGYDKKQISVIEQLGGNYLFACSHYSVKNQDIDEMYFTAVLQQEGSQWKFNYDPDILQKLNAMLIKDAYPQEMLETEKAVTFDVPFLYLDDTAVYEGCVHTALLNLWEHGGMYC